MENERFEAFKRLYVQSNDFFNEGRHEEAWGDLPDSFEYRPPPNYPGTSVLRGPQQIIDHFRSVRKALPDSRGEPVEFIDSGEGPYLIRLRVTGAAPRSDRHGESDLFQVWEFDDRGVPTGVREFTDRELAIEAAGIDE
jgi:ketosteroid isomerase-like protein